MTTRLHDAVVIEADGLARVCAYCTPRPRLDEIGRQFPGRISHSICPRCFLALNAEMDAAEARASVPNRHEAA